MTQKYLTSYVTNSCIHIKIMPVDEFNFCSAIYPRIHLHFLLSLDELDIFPILKYLVWYSKTVIYFKTWNSHSTGCRNNKIKLSRKNRASRTPTVNFILILFYIHKVYNNQDPCPRLPHSNLHHQNCAGQSYSHHHKYHPQCS